MAKGRQSGKSLGDMAREAGARHRAGDLAGALVLYERLLRREPAHPGLLSAAGEALLALGRPREAARRFADAGRAAPGVAVHAINEGAARRAAGELDAALAATRRGLALDARHATAHFNCAMTALERDPGAAVEAPLRRALALDPAHGKARFNLARRWSEAGRDADAGALFRAVASREPGLSAAWGALGVTERRLGRPDGAAAAYRRALSIDPGDATIHANFGNLRFGENRLAECLARYATARRLAPESAEFEWNTALALLLAGDFPAGWEAYRARWRWDGFGTAWPRTAAPAWDGRDLAGAHVLLTAEQGLGDTLHFVRYASLVRARGAGRITLACQPALAGLLAGADGVDRVVPESGPLPEADWVAPLLELPRLFATRLDTIPGRVPYLRVPAGAAATSRRRVGLVWSGNPDYRRDAERSTRLADWAPVLAVPGVDFVSLQVGPGAAALADAPPSERPVAMPPLDSFEATAALVAGLDLVISVDTAVAHLAGALARPVWILIAAAPDWRWLLGRDDSPWYPTARLFRQAAAGDWAGVTARVAAALRG